MKKVYLIVAIFVLLTSSVYSINWINNWIDGASIDAGEYSSLALDIDGYAHISYYNDSNDDLKYAYQDEYGWHYTTIDNAGIVGRYTSIALDDSGYPHISYSDYTNHKLKYAYKDGSGWHFQIIDDISEETSIALDNENHPHIVYNKNNELCHAYHNGINWNISKVDDMNYWNAGTVSIDIDNLNRPHVAYYAYHDLHYSYKNGDIWLHEIVDSTSHDDKHGTSIKIDENGLPHIAYILHRGAYVDCYLNYAYKDHTGWNIDTIDNSSDVGYFSSLYLDSKMYPHISYYDDYPNHDLKYAYQDEYGWHIETVDYYPDVGEWCSLSLNINDEPHISYYDGTNGYLCFARPQTYYPQPFNLRLPNNGSWATSTPLFLWEACSYQGDSLDHYELWIDGSYNTNSAKTRPFCSPSSSLTPGWHTWNIVAIKLDGDSIWSNQTWSVRIDSTPPVSFDLSAPFDSQWVITRRPVFSWDPSGLNRSGLKGFNLYIDSSLVREMLPPDSTSCTPLWSFDDGDYSWFVEAIDTAGNKIKSNQTWTVRIDSTRPEYFSLYYPMNNYYKDTLPIYKWESTNDIGIGMSHYSLWVDNNLEVDSVYADTLQDTIFSQQINALDHGYHSFYIQAFDLLGNIRKSYTRTFYIDIQPPKIFSLISPNDSSLAFLPTPNFTWHSTSDYTPYSSGFSHYELWIDDSLNVGNLDDTLSAPSFPLTEGFHEWFVKAYDNLGNVRNSSETWTVILDWNPPLSFSLSSPADYDTVDIGLPLLYWHPSYDSGSGISKYQLIINGVINADSINSTDTSCTPSSVLDNGTYTWNINAFDFAGGSISSNETWHLVVLKDTINPSIPVLVLPLDSFNTQDTSLNFIWNSSSDPWSGVDYYQIQIAYDLSFNHLFLDTIVTDTNIVSNFSDSSYYWHVRSVDKAGNISQWSIKRCFSIDTHIPATPSLLYPVAGNWIGNSSIEFQWTQSSFDERVDNNQRTSRNVNYNEDSWNVNDRSNSGKIGINNVESSPVRYIFELDTLLNISNPILIDTLDSTTFNINLNEYGYYYWHVKAYDLAGNQSPFSQPDSFGVDITSPVIESTTVIPDTTTIGPFTIDVKITDNVGLDSLFLYYQRTTDPNWQKEELTSTGSDWYSGVIPQTVIQDTVKYYIYARDIAQPFNESTDPAGAPANFYSFVTNALGVEEGLSTIPAVFSLSYNSPAKGQILFRLAIPELSNVSLKIYDLSGRLVYIPINGEYTPSYYEIPFNPETKGMYFFTIESDYMNNSGKLIVF